MKYILGGYSQIPYGASDEEYEVLLTNQLRPLLTLLYRNTSYRFLLRLGQNYYEWLESNHPEINMLIFDLVRKNQLELLASPAYDAFLSLIPVNERSNFVEKTTLYLKKKFGIKPSGFFNSYQMFNPSLINVVSLSMMDYVVTSSFNQLTGKIITNKPFLMNEFGKSCFVFPTDDVFSKAVADFSVNNEGTDKFLGLISKLASQCNNSLHTIMINMDQLLSKTESVEIFNRLYSDLGNKCTLPSTFIAEKPSVNFFYMPDGIYGHDFSIGNYSSLNQLVITNPLFLKHYLLLNHLRNISKEIKKTDNLRKEVDALLFKASSGSCYIDNIYSGSDVFLFSNHFLCQIEQLLVSSPVFQIPQTADITGTLIPADIFYNSSAICYSVCKGAVIHRLVFFDFPRDLTSGSGKGIFYDNFRTKTNDKIGTFSTKNFELKDSDKKRKGLAYFLPQLEVNKNMLKVEKTFELGINSLTLTVDITNLKDVSVNDLIYETSLEFNLGDDVTVGEIESQTDEIDVSSDNLTFESKNTPFRFSILTEKKANAHCRKVKNNEERYKYHQVKLSFPINLGSKGLEHISITIKMEKNKGQSKK